MGLDYLALFFLLVAQKRKTQLQQSVFHLQPLGRYQSFARPVSRRIV